MSSKLNDWFDFLPPTGMSSKFEYLDLLGPTGTSSYLDLPIGTSSYLDLPTGKSSYLDLLGPIGISSGF